MRRLFLLAAVLLVTYLILVAIVSRRGTKSTHESAKPEPPHNKMDSVVQAKSKPPQGPAEKTEAGPKEEPAGKDKGEEAKGGRLAKLKQLSFSRRPSAILKAWAPAPKTDEVVSPKKDPVDEELAKFQQSVTRGNWLFVKTYLASLPDEEAIAGYHQLLESLQQQPTPPAGTIPPGTQLLPGIHQFAERNSFTVEDVIGLAAAAPAGANPTGFPPRAAVAGVPVVLGVAPEGLSTEHLVALASILREALDGGTLPEVVVGRFKAEVGKPGGQGAITHRQAAKLLTAVGHAEFAADFLPSSEQAQKEGDLEALNLLARYFLARNATEAQAGNLENAWAAVQYVLAAPSGRKGEQEEALLRAVELAPRLKDRFGQAWLDESFTKNPDRGMQILATVGTVVARGLTSRPHATEDRLNALKLMKTAVEALLGAAPDRAVEWKPTLTLLAAVWLREAEFSREHDDSVAQHLRRDRYGNMFFFDNMMNPGMQMRQDMPHPIPVLDVIKTVPSPKWVEAVDDSLRPRLAGVAAHLHLKANEEDKAFPMIEHLAPTQPVEARQMVREFLRVWARNHDLNNARNENRFSWFFFAFEQRAEGIPLTRSKQERNLNELSRWAERIRKLPGGSDADEELLVKAFTACHSSAEVYRTDAIESVFGPLNTVKPRTLAALANQMRENLAGLWKDPNEQAKKKTNRKKKDIEAEVLRGYQVARGVVADGLKKFPEHWALLNAQAGLMHDEVNFRQELARSADFSAQRNEAFAIFRRAAEAYGREVPKLPEPEHTTTVYEQWFSASLGAVDLGMITEEQQPDWTQPPLIRKAILSLPKDQADKHLEKFANNLFIRMSGAKPHVKFNYLKAGFLIVEDHKQAAEAKKVFDYYQDLVHEIKLDVVVDGSSRVGHGKPFGVFVNINHTRDIERESGGFGRYLQNQNSMTYSYNYGRPTADYRDRFEAAARSALKEQFEVVSVSFQDDKVHSCAGAEYAWRYTPYAYILLKPRGPQVDKIPPLRIDLDFLETSGYVVLPIESPTVPIDSKDRSGDTRPVDKLTVTQTLDERQANKGVLLLEVKATGVGLVPDLEELCPVSIEGFEIAKIDDQGLAVKKFEEDSDRNAVVSERTWLITLKGQEGLSELPRSFRFPAVKVPAKEVIYQRFNDADLATVAQEVELEQTYGKKSHHWVWILSVGGLLLFIAAGAAVYLVTRPRGPVQSGLALPDNLDPFTAAALLQDIRNRPELSAAQRAELDRDLENVEHYFFAAERNGAPVPDLRRIVERWAATAPGWSPRPLLTPTA